MARSTFKGPVKSETGVELNAAGTVSVESADISGGSASLSITTAQAVESVGTFTPSHKLKISINGTEYWIQLDAV